MIAGTGVRGQSPGPQTDDAHAERTARPALLEGQPDARVFMVVGERNPPLCRIPYCRP